MIEGAREANRCLGVIVRADQGQSQEVSKRQLRCSGSSWAKRCSRSTEGAREVGAREAGAREA